MFQKQSIHFVGVLNSLASAEGIHRSIVDSFILVSVSLTEVLSIFEGIMLISLSLVSINETGSVIKYPVKF